MPSETQHIAVYKKKVTIWARVGDGVIVNTCSILLNAEGWAINHYPHKYTRNNARKVIEMKREMAKVISMIGD